MVGPTSGITVIRAPGAHAPAVMPEVTGNSGRLGDGDARGSSPRCPRYYLTTTTLLPKLPRPGTRNVRPNTEARNVLTRLGARVENSEQSVTLHTCRARLLPATTAPGHAGHMIYTGFSIHRAPRVIMHLSANEGQCIMISAYS